MSEDDDDQSFTTTTDPTTQAPSTQTESAATFVDENLDQMSFSQQGGRGAQLEEQAFAAPATASMTPPPPLVPDTAFQQNFRDNAKPWFSFGSGQVSRTAGPEWQRDEDVSQCTTCARAFDLFNRRHHCRYCGLIFCNSCSSSYKLLPMEFGVREPQRTCAGCAAELEPIQDELGRTMTNQTRQLDFDPDAPSKYLNAPVSFSMTAEISKAAHSVENIFGHVPNAMIKVDQRIPEALLQNAKGIAFLTVLKGGFLVSGKIGTGLVIAKLDQEVNGSIWSAPTAIGTIGIGWGAQIGGELTDFIIVLTRTDALDTFSGASQVAVGAEMGVSVGPFGRTGEASLNFGDRSMAPCYAYSQSSGLFAGVSFEGAVISARNEVNRRFYGKDYSPYDILSGTAVQPPRAAQPLYDAVNKHFLPQPDMLEDREVAGTVI